MIQSQESIVDHCDKHREMMTTDSLIFNTCLAFSFHVFVHTHLALKYRNNRF